MPKRPLRFENFDQAIAEIERLRDGGYTPSGKWNLSQIGEHLTATMRIGLDGDSKPLPWLLRATVLRGLMEAMIFFRYMPSGAKAPQEIQPAHRDADDPAVIETCLATLREARDFSGPLPEYPICTGMTLEKWRTLMLVHAAHHLAYLRPQE
jgi:hypothetical protein